MKKEQFVAYDEMSKRWVVHALDYPTFPTRAGARAHLRELRLKGRLPGVVNQCACGHPKGQHESNLEGIHLGRCEWRDCGCTAYRYHREADRRPKQAIGATGKP